MAGQKFTLDALGGEQLTSSVNSMETFLTEKTKDASLSFKTTGLFSKEDALGAAQSQMESESISALKAKLSTNPIAQAGIDTLTQMGTTIVQQIVGDALKMPRKTFFKHGQLFLLSILKLQWSLLGILLGIFKKY